MRTAQAGPVTELGLFLSPVSLAQSLRANDCTIDTVCDLDRPAPCVKLDFQLPPTWEACDAFMNWKEEM